MVDGQAMTGRTGNDRTSTLGGLAEKIAFGSGDLLVALRGDTCNIHYTAAKGGGRRARTVPLGRASTIVASAKRLRAQFDAKREYRVVPEGELCCFLAFIDAALNPEIVQNPPLESICLQTAPLGALENADQLGHWLMLEVMQGTPGNALLHHLRAQESYALTKYLIQSPGDYAHLNELCVNYGLSYTQFRRLCRRPLGHATKARLRSWRAARTVLEIIESDRTIFDIAVANGYTSASHVSNDIKQIFGFTPKTARNARHLLP
ncbi:helix-turn-helix domain-containing protein [Pandoraea pulmonicola]|uniref:Transcriptional regulator invF n=1 Tax=Pandoraea pulmonicola TaxID=93221 RepID=A0AAJ4ZB24_PANPU|nr:helix-turn-helix domain-containing protein [Pandoraea pulmonicola]SUA90054.1 Transcriptional regulator invF [Pandoraea pulmonicola]